MKHAQEKHGPWCGAKTIPVKCKSCGEEVFYFSCNCGCKVFFDELGGEWPEHYCRRYSTNSRSVKANKVAATTFFTNGLSSQKTGSILKCSSSDTKTVSEKGVVDEVRLKVSLYEILMLERTSTSAKLLGRLADYIYVEVTIHTEVKDNSKCHNFTFYIKQYMWHEKIIVKGDRVACDLSRFFVPDREPIWICKALKRF